MEKYTKESLAKMTPEELENVVLKLQDELEAEKITSKQYSTWWNQETERRSRGAQKLNVLHNLIHSWDDKN